MSQTTIDLPVTASTTVFSTGVLNGGSTVDLVTAAFTLDGSAGAVTNNTVVYVSPGVTLTALGTYDNVGTTDLVTTPVSNSYAALAAGGSGLQLTGGGVIVESGNAGGTTSIYAPSGTIENVNNTIDGSGWLGTKTGVGGFQPMTLQNDAAGVIDANAGSGAAPLTVNPGTVGSVINLGTMAATLGSGTASTLIIEGATVSQNQGGPGGGTILAAGGIVTLQAYGYGQALDISGGTIESTGSGVVNLVGFNVTLDGSTPITLGGNLAVANAATIFALGNLDNLGTLTLNDGLFDNGSSTLEVGNFTAIGGTGTVTLAPNGSIDIPVAATLEIGNTVTGTGTINLGADGVLWLDHAAQFGSSVAIGNFSNTAFNTIYLGGISDAGVSATIELGNTLVVNTPSSGSFHLLLAQTGNYNNLIPVITGGSFITQISLACFAAGTRLLTERGEVAVAAMAGGDRVATASGRLARVRWLGHRHLPAPLPEHMPIRISAGAIAPGMPARDLHLSPDHAVFLDGVLIPVRLLVNGRGIARVEVPAITYWHVELDRHDILLAEGIPAETYLDTGNRAAFANGGTLAEATPDFAARVWDRRACAPLLLGGARLATIARRLAVRVVETARHGAAPG